MEIKPSVQARLALSKQLLTHKASTGGSGLQLVHDLLTCHDAALLGLAAICDQIGCSPHHGTPGLADYCASLEKVFAAHATSSALQFFTGLQQARVNLLRRGVRPAGNSAHCLADLTLQHLVQLSREYLGRELWLDRDDIPFDNALVTEERRKCARHDCEGEAEVRVSPAGPLSRGRILNLSAGGCYVETDFTLEIGRRVEVLLRVNHLSFRASGQVTYAQLLLRPHSAAAAPDRTGMGIRFQCMSSGGRALLAELIQEFENG